MSHTRNDAIKATSTLYEFMGKQQIRVLKEGVDCAEEKQFFIDKICEMANIFATMPKTYEQNGKGDTATAYLHYYYGEYNWYITEKDMGDGSDNRQIQARGITFDGRGDYRKGYIDIVEITSNGAEIDLFFSPVTVGELMKHHNV